MGLFSLQRTQAAEMWDVGPRERSPRALQPTHLAPARDSSWAQRQRPFLARISRAFWSLANSELPASSSPGPADDWTARSWPREEAGSSGCRCIWRNHLQEGSCSALSQWGWDKEGPPTCARGPRKVRCGPFVAGGCTTSLAPRVTVALTMTLSEKKLQLPLVPWERDGVEVGPGLCVVSWPHCCWSSPPGCTSQKHPPR